jgi:hypothetical protein
VEDHTESTRTLRTEFSYHCMSDPVRFHNHFREILTVHPLGQCSNARAAACRYDRKVHTRLLNLRRRILRGSRQKIVENLLGVIGVCVDKIDGLSGPAA